MNQTNSSSPQLLATGKRLGPYEILSLAGVGGMGQVYRAKDTRLDRTVAIKIVSPELILNKDGRERFEREARAVSRLNHPNICTLHDVGQQDGIDFLVMEYLEGETLAARLDRGQLPIEEALKCAVAIADALDKAHRAGITHRDLKPGNIMLTKAGSKLLDFGLARMDEAKGSGESVTRGGAIVGTLQYMAPEQIEGKQTDARTDIFAFGAVLYEMVMGRKAFKGESQTSLMAAILEAEPPAVVLSASSMSLALDRVVRKCLAKDPEDRWQSMRDVTVQLRWLLDRADPSDSFVSRQAHRSGRLKWIIGGIVAGVLFSGIVGSLYFKPPAVDLPEMRLEMSTKPTADVSNSAISPDGRKLVFWAAEQGKPQLWLRTLDSVDPQPLAGTEDANSPFWSPDSRSIAFFATGKLKRMDLSGGQTQTIADAQVWSGGTWGRDDTILFVAKTEDGLSRVPARGGQPVQVTSVTKPQQREHNSPQFLPDGLHFLYTVIGDPESAGIYVASLNAPVGRRLTADTSAFAFAAGYLLFRRESTLFAQPLDTNRLQLTGEPLRVADRVIGFSTANDGTLAVWLNAQRSDRLAWFDRDGKQTGVLGTPHPNMYNPELSPDGTWAAIIRSDPHQSEIWLIDTSRGTESRFTLTGANHPLWSPGGDAIVFDNYTDGALYRKALRGGSEELLLTLPQEILAQDWSPDGRFILYRINSPATGWDLWLIPLEGDRKPVPFANSTFEERDGEFSPDGHWIAYLSNKTGRFEVYVQPFPGPGSEVMVSKDGGAQPRWRHDGHELFYVGFDSTLKAVPITVASDGQLNPGLPVTLFPVHTAWGVLHVGAGKQQYAVTRDGQRFLVNLTAPEAFAPPITLIFNWDQASKKSQR